VILNGTPITSFALAWDPERFGSYDLHLPTAVVRSGLNRMEIVAGSDAEGGSGQTFSIWLIRIRPPVAPTP
jgi:hypothetical protein